ncbi:MAG: ATP-dependent helicase [Thermoplasmata archaeon]
MIIRVSQRKKKEEVLELMEPLIAEWFDNKFESLTEPQGYAIPLIHERENVLVSSPTGSGKTLTAFLSIINELFKEDKKGRLEDKIYCVYVSPLKALANDIHKNLEAPLEELRELAVEKDYKIPEIRTAIRSGDTPQSERRKMVKKPPHIIITTPESLGLVLSSPKFRESFQDVQYFIMDEIHDICSSKRGSFLSMNVERLQAHVQTEMTRIGLSATQAPIMEIAKFLGGFENGEPRKVNVIEVMTEKLLDLSVISPVDDMTLLPYEIVNSRMYDELKEMIEEHRTTLVFTNTRSGAENVAYKLKERDIKDIAAHHGSLSKETRITVEDDLKEGELEAAVSSTSLELGIDVGFIDLVIQVGSPKSVAKGLQRIGRAGHGVGETSKGRMIVFEKDDLVECTVLTGEAYEHNIDRVNIPQNNLDVLAQGIVGMSLEKRWGVDEAFDVLRRSYCYHELNREDYIQTLNYLSGEHFSKVYPKIWYNKEDRTFGKKGGVQMIYYLNIGTIPSDSSYRVFSEKSVPLGTLSEKFVERLSSGDVFVLGGHSYEFIHTKGTKVFVRDAAGKKPTVPSWTGEMLPRSYDLSCAIGRFRRQLMERLEDPGVLNWLREKYRIDKGSAQTLVSYFKEQKNFSERLPTDKKMVIEGYVDKKDRYNIIFHACFGRKVNDALSRAYAYMISKKYNCSTNVSVTDDNFLVSVKKEIPLDTVVNLVNTENIERVLKRGVRNTELFKQRFRHCASRALMILRNYKGRDISVSKQKLRSGKILETLYEFEDHPIIKETYNEILYQVLDLKNAKDVLRGLEEGEMDIDVLDYSEIPSPFAHNVIMVGISDVIMMEDRSSLLRQFHQKVLERVIPKEEIEKFQFERETVEEHFFDKKPSFKNKKGMLEVIKEVEPIHVFHERGNHIYLYTDRTFEEVRKWAKEVLNEEKIQSIWIGDCKWVLTDHVPTYLKTLDQGEQPHGSAPVLNSLKDGKKTISEIYHETDMRLKDVSNIIRELERKRLVNRKGIDEEGEYEYGLLEKYDVDIESVEEVILDYLEYEAPRSLEEISYALSIPEDRSQIAMNNLLDQRKLVSGKLVVGEGVQYMLQEDYHDLRFPGSEHVSESNISEYLAEKQFEERDSIREFFRDFTETSMPYDAFHRVEDFSLERWEKMRRKGEILEGRFLNGKVGYILAEDAPMFVGAYRQEGLSDKENIVLDKIKKGEANTLRQLKSSSDIENEELKEIVRSLDRNLHIIRKYTGQEGWSSTNYYQYLDVDANTTMSAYKEVIRRLLKASGPMSTSDLRYKTGFNRRTVESILSDLILSEEAVKIKVGTSRRELYLRKDELDKLKKVEGDEEFNKLRVLSRKDTYTSPMWAEIYSRYGDDWIFPIIKKGRVIGGIEKWKMSGCIELRHIDLEDEDLLGELIDAIDDMMEYHKLQGYDIVRIQHINNQEPLDMEEDVRDMFLGAGYRSVQGMLVKGNIIEDTFEKQELHNYVLHKQHLLGNKFKRPKDAIRGLRGIRSDFELRDRTEEFFPLRWFYKRGEVYAGKMIPPYLMYALAKETAVYKNAKDVEINHVMETIQQIVFEKEPLPLRTIYNLSPYSKERTKEAVDALYDGLAITRDHKNRYIMTPSNDIDVEAAERQVIRWMFECFGVFSAERLSSYIGADFGMSKIRSILSDLVEEDFLVKGFLEKGNETVMWILKEGLDQVGKIQNDEKIIIPTNDRLNLYFRQDVLENFNLGTANIIFDGGTMVAAFKSRIKRGALDIKEFEGNDKYKKVIKEWAHKHNIGIKSKKKERKVSDYEIQKWYERTRGI